MKIPIGKYESVENCIRNISASLSRYRCLDGNHKCGLIG